MLPVVDLLEREREREREREIDFSVQEFNINATFVNKRMYTCIHVHI